MLPGAGGIPSAPVAFEGVITIQYDVIIIGAGPGGIFTAYELMKGNPALKVAVFELGRPLAQRKCPIDGKKIKSCIKCPVWRRRRLLRRKIQHHQPVRRNAV